MTGATAVIRRSPPRDYLIPPRPPRLRRRRPLRPLRRRHTTRPTARPLPTSHLPPHRRRPRRPRRPDATAKKPCASASNSTNSRPAAMTCNGAWSRPSFSTRTARPSSPPRPRPRASASPSPAASWSSASASAPPAWPSSAAGRKAAGQRSGALLAALDEFTRPRVRQAVADEIFVRRRPILMVAEPHSLCWVSGRLVAHRDGVTWAEEFAQLPALEQVTKDGGNGLAKGLEQVNAAAAAAGPGGRRRAGRPLPRAARRPQGAARQRVGRPPCPGEGGQGGARRSSARATTAIARRAGRRWWPGCGGKRSRPSTPGAERSGPGSGSRRR